MKKLILLLGIAIGTIHAQAQTPNAPDSTWLTLNNKDFSIQYPRDWDLNESKDHGLSFAVLSPSASPEDLFRDNVNLLIQDLSAYNIDLNQYTDISVEQIKKELPKSQIVVNERINTADGEYHRLIYAGEMQGAHLMFEQYYWVVNKKAYILTLTCEVNTFDAYQSIGESIMNTFILAK